MHERSLPPSDASLPTSRPREIFAWAMYDWASSVYSTLSISVIVVYIMKVVSPVWGESIYPVTIGVATLIGAIFSPVIGALTDANRSKRAWLAATALAGSATAVLMAVVPAEPWLVLPLFALMHVFFEVSYVPYNGFLPEIADEESVNRISAWGYALGYVGGGLALLLALVVLQYAGDYGVRCAIALLGLWWGLFTLPTIWILRDRGSRPMSRAPIGRATVEAFREVRHTLIGIRAYRILALFLVAYLLYNDGVQTIIGQASNFAINELEFGDTELLMLILMIQFVAVPGAMFVGWLSDRLGQKLTLVGCLAVLIGVCTVASVVQARWHFWVMGAVFALVMGGTQSVSRAIMARMTPPNRSGEFFGFFGFSGKATSMLGTLLYGLIAGLTGSGRPAIFALLVFFVVGWVLVARVDVERGRREAIGD